MKRKCPLEKIEQIQFIKHCRKNKIVVSASMNGVFLNKKNAIKLIASYKRQGMAVGFPDLFIPEPNTKYHGLFIEMKRITGSTTSKNQIEWIQLLNDRGYYAVICKGAAVAIEEMERYLLYK